MAPADVFGLTQAQKTYLCFYPRDKKGEMAVPPRPTRLLDLPKASLQRDLSLLESMRAMLAPGDYERGVKRIHEIWQSPSDDKVTR